MDGSYASCNSSLNTEMSDTDSFMEMEYIRPRTASENFGYRPRTSSFNKNYPPQPHRPRSSSYGQTSRGGKSINNPLDARLRHKGSHLGSYESVRVTSKELMHKRSQESLGQFSTTSSSESLRKLETASKSSQQSDYVDMSLPRNDNESSYIDMSIGTPSASKGGHSRSSSSHSLSSSPAVNQTVNLDKPSPDIKVVKVKGHTVQKPVGFMPTPPQSGGGDGMISQSTLFSPISFSSASGSRSPSVKGRSPASSGRESEEEGYVPFQPVNNGQKEAVSTGNKEKIKDKKDESRFSLKKKKKDKDKDKKSGHSSPKAAKESKQSPKNEPEQVTDEVYMDYQPGSISFEEPPQSHTSATYSGPGQTQTHLQAFASYAQEVEQPTHISLSRSTEHVASSGIQTPVDVENSYLDYEPGDTSATEATLNKPVSVASFISAEPTSSANDKKVKLKANTPPSSRNSFKREKKVLQPESEYMMYDAEDVNIGTEVKHQPTSSEIVSASTVTNPDQYMDFDPASSTQENSGSKPDSLALQKQKSFIEAVSLKDSQPSCDNRTSESEQSTKAENKRDRLTSKPSLPEIINITSRPSLPEFPATASNKMESSDKHDVNSKSTVKAMLSVTSVDIDEDDDDGYIGLDFSKDRPHFQLEEKLPEDFPKLMLVKSSISVEETRSRLEPVKSEIVLEDSELKLEPVKNEIVVEDSDLRLEPVTSVISDDMDDTIAESLQVKSPRKVGQTKSGGLMRMFSTGDKKEKKKDESNVKESKLNRKKSAPILGQINTVGAALFGQLTSKSPNTARMSPGRKGSVSSLNSDSSNGKKEDSCLGNSSESLDRKSRDCDTCGSPSSDLQKQNSMSSLVPVSTSQDLTPTSQMSTGDLAPQARSRYSCSDLTGAYEEMTLGGRAPLDSSQQSTSQQQLANIQCLPSCAEGGTSQLNYASLVLGSAEDVGDPKSPRTTKSRHASSADECCNSPPLSYAEIDFKKSENLKKSLNNISTPFE